MGGLGLGFCFGGHSFGAFGKFTSDSGLLWVSLAGAGSNRRANIKEETTVLRQM